MLSISSQFRENESQQGNLIVIASVPLNAGQVLVDWSDRTFKPRSIRAAMAWQKLD
jgi:hypothetical protein